MLYFVVFLISLLIPSMAYAHSGVVGGFHAGVTHPVLGLDHFLAMVSVGIISAQLGGRKIWTVPSLFVTVMAIGGALGMLDIGLGNVEVGIALSVVVLGFTIVFNTALPIFLIYGFVSLFAIFHGYAHGLEIPELATSWSYIVGFMVGTAAIHILGVLIGYFAKKRKQGEQMLRYTGAVMAGIGVHIILLVAGL